jgi:hypothetical protein
VTVWAQGLSDACYASKECGALLDSICGHFLYPAFWGGIAQVVRATVS